MAADKKGEKQLAGLKKQNQSKAAQNVHVNV